MEKQERIKELTRLLNEASKAYYQDANEIMSNLEYDKLYDELVELENETGVTLSNSPTRNVGYQVLSELPKERHPSPMLSLDKTKEVAQLVSFIGDNTGYLSWKMDGLTIVLTYNDGQLVKAVTRGNGEIGEVITQNAKVFANVPVSIPFKGELTLRGEAVIKYSDFERINATIDDVDAKYKNPRNLCSGSVRQLNSEITAKRNVNFIAFSFVSANIDGNDISNTDILTDTDSKHARMEWLRKLGFDVVESVKVNKDNMEDAVAYFAKAIEKNDFPSDGLVLTYDSISYSISLGRTAKFPRDSIAFKWRDEQAKTKLKYIEWNTSRTGLINPVAVFEPVELEGTSVSRASVHNLSIVQELELGVGDEILVYKANMIIPQISENLTRTGKIEVPTNCPVCNAPTKVMNENGVKTLHCTNDKCIARKIKSFALFVTRDAMNIEGLSEATIEKFIARGYITEFADIFRLDRFCEEIKNMEGFGDKSYEKLIKSINKAKNVEMPKFIYSLGIPNIGLANAKLICKHFEYDIEKILTATTQELTQVDGLGDIIANGIVDYFADEYNIKNVRDLMSVIDIISGEDGGNEQFAGMVFVITGSVNHFKNRNEIRDIIEKMGGKVASAVSKNTSYLINNDIESSSSKNKKAKELGVPIITEENFMEMAGLADNEK